MFTSTQQANTTRIDSRRKAQKNVVTSYPREERSAQIEDCIGMERRLYERPMTMRQVAKKVGMSASGYLMQIMWDLVDAGRLVAQPVDYRPGWVSWQFTLTEGVYEAYLRRTVKEY